MLLFNSKINRINMKNILSTIFIAVLTIGFSSSAFAQQKANKKEIVTSECPVSGLCVMCKERIENAALIRGVKLAEWDKESGILKVIYRSDKVSLDSIQAGVARAGHDTPLFKAPDEAYEKLPDCCAYRDGLQKH